MNEQSNSTTALPVFVQRLATLPGVDLTLQKVTAAYSYGRNSSPLVQSALQRIEGTVEQLVTTAVNSQAAKTVDTMACSGLDKVENTASSLRASFNATTKAATDYTSNVLKAIESTVCAASNIVISRADAVVETALPPAKGQEDKGEQAEPAKDQPESYADAVRGPPSVDAAAVNAVPVQVTAAPAPLGQETRHVIHNARKLTGKVQARAYYLAMSKLQSVKVRSEAAVEKLKPYTLDLLVYAREHLDKLADMEDDEDEDEHDESDGHGKNGKNGTATSAFAASTTTNNTTTVAGSRTAGAIVSRAQKASRRIVRSRARQVRYWVDTGVFVINWAAASVAQVPAMASNVGVLVRMEATNAANAVHRQVHAASYNALVLVHTVQHYSQQATARALAWKDQVVHGMYNVYEQHVYPLYEKDLVPFYQHQIQPMQQHVADSLRFGVKVGSDVVVLAPQAVTMLVQIVLGYAVVSVSVIENSTVVRTAKVKLTEAWNNPEVVTIRHYFDNAIQRVVHLWVVRTSPSRAGRPALSAIPENQ